MSRLDGPFLLADRAVKDGEVQEQKSHRARVADLACRVQPAQIGAPRLGVLSEVLLRDPDLVPQIDQLMALFIGEERQGALEALEGATVIAH